MRVAPGLMALGQIIIFASDQLWPVVIGMALSGFGAGLAIPAATSAASLAVNADEQGSAIGLASSAGASGFILSPLLGFTLYDVSPAAPFIFTASGAVILLCYAWISRKIGGAVPPQIEDVPEEALSEPAAAPYQ